MYTFIYSFLVMMIVYIFWLTSLSNLIPVASPVDGRVYLVNNLPDRQDAADTLATIRGRIKTLVDSLEDSDPYFQRLKARFHDIVLTENPLLRPKKTMTSYSVNKGERIVFCLRDPDNMTIHPINIIMYVALHEFAHIACPEVGHTPLFIKIFKSLVQRAAKADIYALQDYSVKPVNYCGIKISEHL